MQQDDWWRSAVIYQVYPRSFFSMRGNSIGDLAGITAKSAYLKKLGVDIVWISPFFQSPMKDYGYDVSDYCAVDPIFGSLSDFDSMVNALHACGLKVMIDQVYNHTSEQHPWFVESRADKENAKADWYIWKDPTITGNAPNNWMSLFSGPAWSWYSGRRQYYLHQFLKEQPDLNFNNPQVQNAILDAAEFWLKRQVDGFRLDTVSRYVQDPRYLDNPPFPHHASRAVPVHPFMMQQEKYNQGQPGTLAFLKRLRALADRYNNAVLLGELGTDNENELQGAYTAGNDALHIAYTFQLLHNAVTPQRIAQVFADIAPHIQDGWPSWAFSNHDVVRAISRPGTVTAAYQDSYAKLLLTLLLALRGTPCIYQGEELALSDQDLAYDELQDPFSKNLWPEWRGRDGCRTPIPWQKEANYGGFSTCAPWLPVKENHRARAVDQQEMDPHSTLNFYRQFIRWRKGQQTLCGKGALEIMEADANLLCFVREGSPSLYCAYNFGEQPQRIKAQGTMVHYPQCGAQQQGDVVILPPYGSAFIVV